MHPLIVIVMAPDPAVSWTWVGSKVVTGPSDVKVQPIPGGHSVRFVTVIVFPTFGELVKEAAGIVITALVADGLPGCIKPIVVPFQ